MSKRTSKKKKPAAPQQLAVAQTKPVTSEPHEQPTTSPAKLMAALFGIPLAVLIAAAAVRILSGN